MGMPGSYDYPECLQKCFETPGCNAIEINGCNSVRCDGKCYLYTSVPFGTIYNGGCDRSGKQRGYTRKPVFLEVGVGCLRGRGAKDPHGRGPQTKGGCAALCGGDSACSGFEIFGCGGDVSGECSGDCYTYS